MSQSTLPSYYVAQQTFADLTQNVKFKLEIENDTDVNVETIAIIPHTGYVKIEPPKSIATGKKEAMVGHKVSTIFFFDYQAYPCF